MLRGVGEKVKRRSKREERERNRRSGCSWKGEGQDVEERRRSWRRKDGE